MDTRQMTPPPAPPDGQTAIDRTTAKGFSDQIMADANNYLAAMLGSEQGKVAAARVAMAFSAAARAAKDPTAFYRCSRASIVAAIANSALHNLMPGGQLATVWLVPKGGELQWWLSHRGMMVLALRAGYQIVPVPVHVKDTVTLSFGEVTAHECPDGYYPERLEELKGCYLTIRRLSDGMLLGRPWLPAAAILRRRQLKDAGPVWNVWPIEMAMKTVIRWAMARGLVPIETTELLGAMEAEPVIDVTAVTEEDLPPAPEQRGAAALLSRIEDLPAPDPAPAPEPVEAKPAPEMKPDPAADPLPASSLFDAKPEPGPAPRSRR